MPRYWTREAGDDDPGQTVTLTWCCTNCGYEWPIAPEDEELADEEHAGD